ncbi:tetratricopeptide repeat protein [Myxococcota bacterium]|nr:tetratricopeptide repeat protein [Myxococcota bacterium]
MKHELFDQWLRDGQPPVSDELRRHLGACPRCSGEYEELLVLRDLTAGPDPLLTEKRSAEIRFTLEAESNRKRSSRELPTRSWLGLPRIPWAFAAAAAALAGILIGGALLVRLAADDGHGDADSLAWFGPAPGAEITPDTGARWSRRSLSGTELVMLEEGTLRIRVRRLAPGQAFMVKTGADWVEVRGTAFSVTAGDGLLQVVEVTEGVVSVHAAAGSLLLLAGQQWRRPAQGPPPPLPPTDPAIAGGSGTGATPADPAPPKATSPADSMQPVADSMQPVADSMQPVADSMTPPPNRTLPARTTDPPAESPLLIRFSEAYRTIQAGNWRKAVTLFSDLLQEHGLGAKRADVLFWLAQAHLKGGQHPQAIARLQEFLRSYPNAWHAKDAREQLRLLQTEK